MRTGAVATQRSGEGLGIEVDWLQGFEERFDPARLKTDGTAAVHLLGCGRLIAALGLAEQPEVALKRLPPFPSPEARSLYRRAVDAYHVVLKDQIGLDVPEQRCVAVTSPEGAPVLYIVQTRQEPETFAPYVLAHASEEEVEAILEALLHHTVRVWNRNEIDGPESLTGLDARLANWTLLLEEGKVGAVGYVDTTTPFVRRIGHDLLDPEVFLQRVPGPLAGLLRSGLHRAHARYYDLRLVLIDFVADLYTVGQAERIPLALEVINRFLHSDQGEDFYLDPITRAEVDGHHRKDTRFWTTFRTLSRVNRFFTATLFRQPYPHVLPVAKG